MGTIKLYKVTESNVGVQLPIKDYPGLSVFKHKSKRVSLNKVNVDKYFTGLGLELINYTKIAYGPVFGVDDPRNGFIYEHNTTGELVRVDEKDLPTYHEQASVVMGDLISILKTDTKDIQKGVVTDSSTMIKIQEMVNNKDKYADQIRGEWQPNMSFLIIE
jgi:hypothetical protein